MKLEKFSRILSLTAMGVLVGIIGLIVYVFINFLVKMF